jgi:hypothetical protein
MLNGEIGTLIEIVRMKKDLLCFLEADSAPGIAAKALALPLIELDRMRYNSYTTVWTVCQS